MRIPFSPQEELEWQTLIIIKLAIYLHVITLKIPLKNNVNVRSITPYYLGINIINFMVVTGIQY